MGTMMRQYLAAILWRGAGFAAIWWLLSGGRVDGLGVGAVSVVLALSVSLRLLPPSTNRLSVPGCAAFVGFFLLQSVKAGVQVTALALAWRLDLRPAMIDLPLTLPPGFARVLLADTLSLLPGTLSVRLHGDTLLLHTLDQRLPVAAEVRAAEAAIARIFRADA